MTHKVEVAIYIPLWFYLYCKQDIILLQVRYIYIPLWFYLYEKMSEEEAKAMDLHSTMVLLIRETFLRYNLYSQIYIPLWFYLYKVHNFLVPLYNIFTFHYGSTYTVSNTT